MNQSANRYWLTTVVLPAVVVLGLMALIKPGANPLLPDNSKNAGLSVSNPAITHSLRRDVRWPRGERIQEPVAALLPSAKTDVGEIRLLAGSDPRAAAARLVDLTYGPIREQAVVAVAVAWANTNLTEAEVWAGQLSDSKERQNALIAIANEATRNDPVAALTLAAQLPPDPARDDLVIHAAAQWAATTPTNAAAWVEAFPDSLLRQRVASAVATEWAETDPYAATALALQNLPPGRLQDDAVMGIVERWAQSEPDAAAAWVREFPPGPLRETALAVLNPPELP